jgi:hypothetical protein
MGNQMTSSRDGYSVMEDSKPSSWQYSFSYHTCQALILDICATYLYLVGQDTLRISEISNRRDTLLEYVSKAWFIHFVVLHERIDSPNLPYYLNLCHPQFPGLDGGLLG